RSPHSVWFGLLAETGYPGLGLFVVILILAVWSCRRVRVIAKRDSTRIDLGRYSVAIETALIVYAVGGTFLPAQYNEMVWHYIGVSTALYLLAKQEAPAVAAAVSESIVAQPALAR